MRSNRNLSVLRTHKRVAALRAKHLGLALLCLGLVLAIVGLILPARPAMGRSAAGDERVTLQQSTSSGHALGVILIGVKPGEDIHNVTSQFREMWPHEEERATAMMQAEAVFPFARDAGIRLQASAASKLARIYRFHLPPDVDVEAGLMAARANPAIEFAEPDYLARPAVTPNDLLYSDQWGLAKIGAESGWDVTTGAVSITLAIIDSGIDLSHEDLSDRLWTNPGETAGNGVDDDGNGLVDDVHGWNFLTDSSDLTDENGHGTQVAGVAAAASNNGAGVAGVCWNCRVMVVKIMQASGTVNYSDIAAGVAYAAGQGAQVINLSLGGYADSETLRTAIESAAATAVIVAGAGNDDTSTPFYPAAYPEVIAVAGTDQTDTRASFSNYGSWVNVTAPGVEIKTTFAGNNSYGSENGTSMSSPFVTGLAGLLTSQYPDWSPALVRQHIINTATSVDGGNPDYAGQLGQGRIHAGNALTTAPQPAMEVPAWALDGEDGALPEPGESYQLALTLDNTWQPARSLSGILSTADAFVSISDANGSFGNLNTGQSGSNSGDTFAITLQSGTPYNHPIDFTLNLSGDDGYALSLSFTLNARSGIEEIPNGAVLDQDTLWTNDKTYVLLGNAIVGQGITLTIQPGTLVKVTPDKFFRIDGSLVASGSAGAPIVFTSNSTSSSQWQGLRFIESSGGASFDQDGNYSSGSILRYVEISYAQTGVNLLTRAPYIADSTFQYNGTAVSTGSSAPRIERCTFSGNSTGINVGDSVYALAAPLDVAAPLSGGGRPLIAHNTLTGNGTGISGGGSPTIISNTLANNTGTAINLSSWMDGGNAPTVQGNRIVGNGGGVILSNLQGVNIQHNLIANTENDIAMDPYGGALVLDVSSSGVSQQFPALDYNPDRDEYLLLWAESAGTGYQLKGQRLQGDGQATGPEISVGETNEMYQLVPNVVYNPTQQDYLVAWSVEGAGIGGVLVQRLTGEGTLLGSPITVLDSGWGSNVHVVYQAADDKYLLVWQDNSAPASISGHHINTDGTLSGGTFAIGQDMGSSDLTLGDVAYDPGNERSLILFRSSEYYNRLYDAWVASAGTQTGASFQFTQDPDWQEAENPSLTFNPVTGRYFAAWQRGWGNEGIRGQVALADGSAPVSQTVVYTSTDYVYSPDVAYASSNNQFLTVWYQYSSSGIGAYSIYGQRVDTDGTTAGTPIAISTPGAGSRDTPILAHNSRSDEYLAVWRDCRSESCVLYGQRLSAEGQLLDNEWSAADETSPTVNFRPTQGRGVRNNTIINNGGYGVSIAGSAAGDVTFVDNNWFGNGDYDVYMRADSSVTVTLGANYWGDTVYISSRVYDCYDTANGCGSSQSTIGRVVYEEPLSNPAQSAPAFAQAVSINPDPLGIEQGTFEVSFSRPMVTDNLPTLSFFDYRRGMLEEISDVTSNVSSIAQDALGRLWFGSNEWENNPGVCRYNFQDWETFDTTNSGLASNGVNAIYGAANGDVWFAHSDNGYLSRLQGTTWITYTPESTGYVLPWSVQAIGEDAQGNMWFGSGGEGAVRFDGSAWQRYTTVDGLVSDNISHIARDSQGRMWFSTYQGLSVYDGIAWTTYDRSNELPTNETGALFADSQGRIWVGLSYYDDSNWEDSIYAGVFDGSSWMFYGPGNTNSVLNGSVQAFAEDLDGNIWAANSWSSFVVFDGDRWSSRSDLSGGSSRMLFDARGNLWMASSMSSGLRVLWGGVDYPIVDNGEWISPTLYQATYDVNPIVVPQGTYAVGVADAAGLDEMDIAPDCSTTFEMVFAGFVSDDTPPSQPQAAAVSDGSLSTLSLSWSSSDPDGIAQYSYALGTTPRGTDVVDWKYSTSNSVRLTGLLLVEGQTYYAAVKAQNTSGLWSQVGVSNAVVGGEETVIQEYVYSPLVIR